MRGALKLIFLFVVLMVPAFSEQEEAKAGIQQEWKTSADKKDSYFRNKALICQMLYIGKCTADEVDKSGLHDQLVRDMTSIWVLQDRGIYKKNKLYKSIIKTAFTVGCLQKYNLPKNPTDETLRLLVSSMGVNIDNDAKKAVYMSFIEYVDAVKEDKDILVLDELVASGDKTHDMGMTWGQTIYQNHNSLKTSLRTAKHPHD